MKQLNRSNFPGASYPEKIIQFGEGNFLRAFIDWQIDHLNEQTDLNAGVVLIRPIDTGFPASLSTQDGLYTTLIRGLNEQGESQRTARIIRSVTRELNVYQDFPSVLVLAENPDIRFVFSNTTEAGITYQASDALDDAPASSFPAKLTQLLYRRFSVFNGAADKGWIILPCELIDYNGEKLKAIIQDYAKQWQLPAQFSLWLNEHNTFCSTLVDRIVTGFPGDEHKPLQEEFGYSDQFMDTAEYFYLFVIQGPKWLSEALCLDQLSPEQAMNIKIVDDIKPYKERKVAILNGAHTAMVPVAFLAGIDSVGESMADQQITGFIENTIFNEIIPTLNLPQDELKSFANDVLDRFRNPFIKHQLSAIALNSMTKYQTRILPQLLTYYQQTGKLPVNLTFALAALIAFYRGQRDNQTYPLQDDQKWLQFYQQGWADVDAGRLSIHELVKKILGDADHWGQDLTQVPGLTELTGSLLSSIYELGMRAALTNC